MADTPNPKASAPAQGAGNPSSAGGAPAVSTAGGTPAPQPEEIRAQVFAEVATQLKAATGHDSTEALEAAQAKAEADKLAEQGNFKTLAEQAQAKLTHPLARAIRQLCAGFHGIHTESFNAIHARSR
jgi:hypothetical protein